MGTDVKVTTKCSDSLIETLKETVRTTKLRRPRKQKKEKKKPAKKAKKKKAGSKADKTKKTGGSIVKKRGKKPARMSIPAPPAKAQAAAKKPLVRTQSIPAGMTVYNDGTTTWDMKLTFIDPAINSDKFYDTRILVDAAGGYTLEKRWGRTGTAGEKKVEDNLTLDNAKSGFEKIVSEKKAKGYEEVVQDRGIAPRQSSTKWQYHLTNDKDGKPDGWYNYVGDVTVEDSAMSNMERYYEEWKSNPRLAVRFVQSGHFTYKVSFSDMTQMNTTTSMQRPIQRI